MLAEWHELYTNALPDELTWTMGERYVLRRVAGSKFRISSAEGSPGIQAIDVVLWLFKRVVEDAPLERSSALLMQYVLKHAHQSDLSFESVGAWLEKYFADISSQPLTEEQMQRAREYVRRAEERRQASMAQFAQEKLNNASNISLESDA